MVAFGNRSGNGSGLLCRSGCCGNDLLDIGLLFFFGLSDIFCVLVKGPGNCKCYDCGHKNADGVCYGVSRSDEEAKDTRDAVRDGNDAENGDKCSANGSANHSGDKRLHAGEVDTVDSRLSDAEEAGDTGGECKLLFLHAAGLYKDCETGSALCHVAAGDNGIEVVDSGIGNEGCLKGIEHVVYAKDNGCGIDGTNQCSAETKGYGKQELEANHDAVFNPREERADNRKS